MCQPVLVLHHSTHNCLYLFEAIIHSLSVIQKGAICYLLKDIADFQVI